MIWNKNNLYDRQTLIFVENFSETIIDEMMPRLYKPDVVLADIQRLDDSLEFKLADVPSAEKLEKFVEDVKYVLMTTKNWSEISADHAINKFAIS